MSDQKAPDPPSKPHSGGSHAAEPLAAYRARLAEVDEELVRLLGERQSLAIKLGLEKQKHGIPIRDFAQERFVLDRVAQLASWHGVSQELVLGVFKQVIDAALRAQERGRVRADASGSGRRALVIGGAGRMGRWFVRFLSSQRFDVEIADPSIADSPGSGSASPIAEAQEGFPAFADWRSSALDHDVIVVAAPLGVSGELLVDLAEARPRGLVLDVASLKGPVQRGLEALRASGSSVASIHPMFGPDTDLLSERHVIFIDLGDDAALARAKELFDSTMARPVDMRLADHDRLIAFVLGVSHALNIAFGVALAESGEEVPELADASSSTFDAQLGVTERVVLENPDLYFEIQVLNSFGLEALATLEDAVQRLVRSVRQQDRDSFAGLMAQAQRHLGTP